MLVQCKIQYFIITAISTSTGSAISHKHTVHIQGIFPTVAIDSVLPIVMLNSVLVLPTVTMIQSIS